MTEEICCRETARLTIRKCEALEEMQACVRVAEGSVEIFATRNWFRCVCLCCANQNWRACDRGRSTDERRLVGFALAIPGIRNGHCYLHSQMLAVRQQYRNGGLGRRMKLYQREDALARGFELMEWTFDPLEIKNAYLNIEKLGAIARRYNVNQYGITSSPLQGGLPSDRLVAEWWMKSRRVETVLAGDRGRSLNAATQIDVPAEIYEWKAAAATRARALAVQRKNREHILRRRLAMDWRAWV